MTYDSTDKVLFSADGFGKFGALDVEENWDDGARRYFIGIVGKYGAQVQRLDVYKRQEVSLSEVLHDLKTIISGQIHAKQLELYMDVMDVTNEDVYCDKTRLNQVLLNLLSNEIKFTPRCV